MPDPIQVHAKAVPDPWSLPFETQVWVSKHTGETLAIRRNEDIKTLCGYVLLDPADPLVSAIKGKDIEGDFYVHGGVTWNDPISFFPGKHAVGFDCAHSWITSRIRAMVLQRTTRTSIMSGKNVKNWDFRSRTPERPSLVVPLPVAIAGILTLVFLIWARP